MPCNFFFKNVDKGKERFEIPEIPTNYMVSFKVMGESILIKPVNVTRVGRIRGNIMLSLPVWLSNGISANGETNIYTYLSVLPGWIVQGWCDLYNTCSFLTQYNS